MTRPRFFCIFLTRRAAKRLIPATLELGGKSANIVFDDAQLEKAVEGAQIGILFNQGQVCCAGSRIFVQEGIYDEFVAKLAEAFKKVKVGNPMDMSTQMGSQINERQLEKILKYVEIGKEEGAVSRAGSAPWCPVSRRAPSWNRPFLRTSRTTCVLLGKKSSGRWRL